MADVMTYRIDFSGLKPLIAIGPKVAGEYGNKALLAGTVPIIESARENAPVSDINEPHLRDSLDTKVLSPQNGRCRVLIGFDEPAARHAGFVEFGTSKMKAEPFMRPAIHSQGQAAVDEIAASLWASIESDALKRFPENASGGLGGAFEELFALIEAI